MVMALTCGKTVVNIMVSGRTTICRVWAFISTLMEFAMTANTKMTRKRVSAYTTGPMAANTRDGGTKGNNTV
jgi:hypothetical protein